ncbi:MAG: TetR/AcrR family transcriptional regulator [Sphingomonadales bacterium]
MTKREDEPRLDPRRERRRGAMLDAARALFLEQGYDAVSLQDVVARSGGSLSTLYALFGNKRGLLKAVMRTQFERDMREFEGIAGRGASPAETLVDIALGSQEYLAAPDMIRFMRFVIGESLRSPEFGQKFFENVHLRFLDRYVAMFTRWNDEGLLRITDPDLAARQFVSLVLHDLHVRAIYTGGDGLAVSRHEAEQAVALFLSYYRR